MDHVCHRHGSIPTPTVRMLAADNHSIRALTERRYARYDRFGVKWQAEDYVMVLAVVRIMAWLANDTANRAGRRRAGIRRWS